MDSNKNNASDSQVWHTDTDPYAGTEKPVARSKKITVGPSLFPHNLVVLPGNDKFMEKVFAYVGQKLGRPEEHKMEQVNTSLMIWGLFVTASMRAAVHLRKDYAENLRAAKNTKFSEIKPLFNITWQLILDQEDEILGVSTTGIKLHGWEVRLFRFGAVSWRQNCRISTICAILDEQN